MNKELFILKISNLSDEKLKELLQFRNQANHEIISLAEIEASKRGIDPTSILPTVKPVNHHTKQSDDEDRTNWFRILAEFLS